MILITDSFSKNLKKIKSVTLKHISTEIEKHTSGLNNFIELSDIHGNKVFKGYLLSKKVRVLTYFQKVGNVFVPFYVVKKETKNGYNITANLEKVYLNQLSKSIQDIEDKNFKVLED